MANRIVLEVRDLTVTFDTPNGPFPAVSGVSFEVTEGETLALVGESGAGKSVTALAIPRLMEGRVTLGGSIALTLPGADTVDLLSLDARAMRQVRGRGMAMVFQEPMNSLNPVMRAGEQIAEAVRAHETVSRRAAAARAVDLLRMAGIPDPVLRARAFPHELSGGMRQRVMIAMALAGRPALLIADEPTTALDVTVQARVLALLRSLQREFNMAMLFITHDLGVVAHMADRVAVMRGGRIVESATASDLFARPQHPYTQQLLHSVLA